MHSDVAATPADAAVVAAVVAAAEIFVGKRESEFAERKDRRGKRSEWAIETID